MSWALSITQQYATRKNGWGFSRSAWCIHTFISFEAMSLSYPENREEPATFLTVHQITVVQRNIIRFRSCWPDQQSHNRFISTSNNKFMFTTSRKYDTWNKTVIYNTSSILRRMPSTPATNTHTYCKFWLCVCSLTHQACNAHAPYYIVIFCLCGSTTVFHII
jgi:hypothetical protein